MGENRQTSPRFLIQVKDVDEGSVELQMATSKFIQASDETLKHVAGLVRHACGSFITELESLDARPKECAIEFGVDVAGEAGIPFVTKGSLGANFKVTITWSW